MNHDPETEFIKQIQYYNTHDHKYYFNRPYEQRIPNVHQIKQKIREDKDYKEKLQNQIIEILKKKFGDIVFKNDF